MPIFALYMDALIMTAQLLLGLSILVIFHEAGHFWAARAFGIKVEKFYLFFDAWGFKLFSFKIGDTEYGMGWLPFGGYVKIAGMIDESMDLEQMKQEPKPWEFRTKPAWQRLIVMLGGIIVNLILGMFIFSMILFSYGEKKLPASALKNGIAAKKLGREIGLQNGDHLLAVNQKPLQYYTDLYDQDIIFGDHVTLTVLRGNDTVSVVLPDDFGDRFATYGKDDFINTRFHFQVKEVTAGGTASKIGLQSGDKITGIGDSSIEYFDQIQAALQVYKGTTTQVRFSHLGVDTAVQAEIGSDGILGFRPEETDSFQYEVVRHGFFPSLAIGSMNAFAAFRDNIKGFGKIFAGKVKASNAVQGPIGMAAIYGSHWDWLNFWSLTALISLALAFMNLLPIPALDGGHVVFLLLEMIMRRKLSDKFMERAQTIGFFLLLSLMVLVFGNDIIKHFF